MAFLELGQEQVRYEEAEAQHALLGYALAALDEGESGPHRIARWAYRGYDCCLSDPRVPLQSSDLLAVGAIRAEIKTTVLGELQAASVEASRAMAQIPRHWNFWDMPNDAIPSDEQRPWPDPFGEGLLIAYDAMCSVDDVKLAKAHKILHHKWPNQFPLIDGETERHLRRGENWLTIHEELAGQSEQFEALELWFVQTVTSRYQGCVGLTRLRIHDILLWLDATHERDAAIEHGDRISLRQAVSWAVPVA